MRAQPSIARVRRAADAVRLSAPALVGPLVVALALMLQACGPSWAPVEDRSTGAGPYRTGEFGLTPDGRYRVRRGDSLHVIAFDFGLDWRDLAKWNRIEAPYTIYPDQELRLSPPQAQPAPGVMTRPAATPGTVVSRDAPSSRPPVSGPVEPATQPEPARVDNLPSAEPPDAPVAGTGTAPVPGPEEAVSGPAVAAATVPPSVTQTPESQLPDPPPPARQSDAPLRDPDRWLWPTDGRLLSSFQSNDPARNGIDIAGQEGQPVRASAPGEVVYSGSGLIGYGELIIVKHSDRLLSAYAHNRQRQVQEGQRVAAGEQIAEMGRNDRNQAVLHFEIRLNGTPQDPLKYLPRR